MPPTTRCGDRKSTRLNSSHITISYAVFCLKKKSAVKVSRPLYACVVCGVLREATAVSATRERLLVHVGAKKFICDGTCAEFFFFNDTATTEIYTLSLHDALPI